QYAAIISVCCDMTAICASTGSHCHLQGLRICRIECSAADVVTIQTAEIGVLSSFVTICSGRNAPAPPRQRHLVGDAHAYSNCRIKIGFDGTCRLQLVTDIAVLRIRRDSGISVMTRETNCVAVNDRFEAAFLKPECVA